MTERPCGIGTAVVSESIVESITRSGELQGV